MGQTSQRAKTNSGRHQPGLPSTFPPPDARPRGTGRNGRGRRVSAGAVGRPFVHVTGAYRGQVGMGRDPRCKRRATCKIAGIAYTGSNPVPATQFSCGNTQLCNSWNLCFSTRISISFLSTSIVRPKPALLPGRRGPQSAWPGGVASGEAGGCRFYWPACRRRRGAAAPRSRWRAPWPPAPRPASGAANADAPGFRRLRRRSGMPGWRAPAAPGAPLGAQQQVELDGPGRLAGLDQQQP
jgi:hypothetical protein